MRPPPDNWLERFQELPKVKMSNWYDIFGLFRTVVDVFLSGVFQSRIDHRTLRALELAKPDAPKRPPPPHSSSGSDAYECGDFIDHDGYFEYRCRPDQSFWFDYAADVGDGFNSTYYVAALLSQQKLEVLREDPEADWLPSAGKKKTPSSAVVRTADAYLPLPRGRFLLLGGDQVYPSASRRDYEMRFTRTYEAACYVDRPPDRQTAPHLYAVPGNHDWYDGLSAFMEVFAERRSIGHFRTVQQTSYFAIKLPHGFWIFAIDIGLSGELDRRQVEYFQKLAAQHLSDGERIILSIAEPDWVKARPNVRNLRDGLFYFERKLAEALCAPGKPRKDVRVVLRLAGDLHHYRRHVSSEPLHPTDEAVEKQDVIPDQPRFTVENITAGGGGAFLHPTHEVDADRGNSDGKGSVQQFPAGFGAKGLHFTCKKAFPCVEESTQLTRRTLGFAFHNGSMFVALWLIYLLVMGTGLALVAHYHYLWTLAIFGLLLVVVPAATASYARGEASGEIGESKSARVRRVYRHRPRLSRAGSWGMWHGVTQVLFLFLVFVALCVVYRQIACGGHLLGRCEPSAPLSDPLDAKSLGQLVKDTLENDKWSSIRFGLSAVAAACAAGLSCLLFGAYLFWALNKNKLRLHANGAFAALRIADYKNFLRIEVRNDALVVHAIGIRKVPTRWTLDGSARRREKAAAQSHSPAVGRALFLPKRAPSFLGFMKAAVAAPAARYKAAHHFLTQVEPDTEPFLIERELQIPK